MSWVGVVLGWVGCRVVGLCVGWSGLGGWAGWLGRVMGWVLIYWVLGCWIGWVGGWFGLGWLCCVLGGWVVGPFSVSSFLVFDFWFWFRFLVSSFQFLVFLRKFFFVFFFW